MRPTLYEFAGGDQAFYRLAAAHHARCLADPELNHPFSHPDGHPEHLTRLAHYWAEVLGGPTRYSDECADQSYLVQLHAGNGDMTDLGERFVKCFVQAMDDAELPQDREFRKAMQDYMVAATKEMTSYPDKNTKIPNNMKMPHWTWNGPTD